LEREEESKPSLAFSYPHPSLSKPLGERIIVKPPQALTDAEEEAVILATEA
jgi:hypothetical protein